MRGYPVQRRSVFSVSGFGSLAVGRLLSTGRLHHCRSRQHNRDMLCIEAVANPEEKRSPSLSVKI